MFGLSGLLVAAAAGGWLLLRPTPLENRIYRIGWAPSPPFQVRTPDGGPAGIAVDLVKEAARRRGIQLHWIAWEDTSESALDSGAVDLWPLITIRPERLKKFHITEPYLEHEHCLLVREDSPFYKVTDLAHGRVGMANISIDARTLKEVLPEASPVSRNTIDAVLGDVCNRTSDAAYMDRYTAVAALLRDTGCTGINLRWIPVAGKRSRLGIGSTFAAAPVADALRKEITGMAAEGGLSSIFSKWGFMSSQDVGSVELLLNASRRVGRLYVVVVVFALLFVLACWQALWLMRERERTRRTEAALRESQERFMQAQKMESIGRLAGGVAHDFNNLLTVINGYSDLVYRELPESDPKRTLVDQIRKAGQRAADLTSQLLAFGRKQVSRPRLIDLNSLVRESQGMLGRLLGEDIQLSTSFDPSLGVISADPGQIHQVLMNLAVNARDAMPHGGTLAIETANEDQPVPAVRLSITDTGVGMDEETRKNIFEPFFTTKGPTKGTGLGLATVYGIVKQSKGWIDAVSEPGKGATFHLHFPRAEGRIDTPNETPKQEARKSASGVVLVVEDQQEVRDFAVQALTTCGYRVLEAADADEALDLVDRNPTPLHVLLTDVILPGMNGRELAERIRATRPRVKVIYTSGYARDVIATRGVLEGGVEYIPKPYTAETLADRVREAMEA